VAPRSSIVVAALIATATSGFAADFRATGFYSQRFDVRASGGASGRGDDEDDFRFRTRANLGLNLQVLTPRLQLRLAPGVSGSLSSADDADQDVNFRLNSSLAYTAPLTTVTGSLSVVPEFVEEAQFEDTGRVDTTSTQITVSGRLGVSRQVSPRTSLSVSGTARTRTFTGSTPTLSETRSFGVSSGLSRLLAPETSANLSTSLRYFESDNDTNSYSLNLAPGFSHRVNTRLQLAGSLGAAFTLSERQDGSDETDFSPVGSLNVNYNLADTSYSLGVSQDIDQTSEGALEAQVRLNGGVTRRINSVSNIGVSAAFGFQNPLFATEDERQTFSISPRYSYDLTEDWALSTGVRFRASNDEDFEDSTVVFLQVSRGLSFIP